MTKLIVLTLMVASFSGLVFSLDYPKYETRTRLSVTQNGEYNDLVVAIGIDLVEDAGLIDSIKGVIDEFSMKLHQLTGLFFDNVRIVVPESWRPNPQLYSPLSWETFDNSDIRIDHVGATNVDRRICRDAPFTVKPSQCGSPGRYIVLTPNFVQDPNIAEAFGGHGKAMLREWAKYRWGAFDESPNEEDPHFYASSSGDIEATRCSKERKGVWRTSNNEPCQRSRNGLPEQGCRFVDDAAGDNSGEEASIMYRQYIDSIGQFCEHASTTNAKLAHNIESPSSHNKHCDRKSVWEVFLGHADRSTAIRRVQWRAPQYHVVHRSNGKIVLVLDKSSSMSTNERINILRQAAYNFIARVIPDGYMLGIVEFNHLAVETAPLTAIDSGTRMDLLQSLSGIYPGGFTSIGKGVRRGLDVLEGGLNGNPAGGQMIVISDGVNTENPDIAKVLLTDGTEISTVTIHTIAVGPEVDNDLEALANTTGGRHYQHTDFSTTLFDVFSQFGFDSLARQNAEIYSATTQLLRRHQITVEVYIDERVEGDILFLVGTSSVESLTLKVRRPDDVVLDMDTEDSRFGLISIRTYDVMVGSWIMTIANAHTEVKQLSILVEGGVASSIPPITVYGHWALANVIPPEAQALYVTVMKGYVPVANTTVYASVTHNETEVRQQLYDDGVGADMRANDGIYSAYFTRVDGDGRYGAKIFVSENEGGTTRVLTSRCRGESTPTEDVLTARSISTDIETGRFQRVVDAGSFKCNSQTLCNGAFIDRLYGPAKVSDLRVENINLRDSEVDLVFTSPGSNLMDGRATRYTIRFARSFDALHSNFEGSREVLASRSSPVHFSSRNRGNVFNPKAARSTEVFTLKLAETGNYSYVFGLTATDDHGLVSPVSNYASVSAKYFNMPFPVPSTTTPKVPSTTTTRAPMVSGGKNPNLPGDQDNNVRPTDISDATPEMFPWYFILLGLLLIIIILLILIMSLWKRRSRKDPDDTIVTPNPSREREATSFENPILYTTPGGRNVGYSPSRDSGSEYEASLPIQSDHPPTYAESFVTVPPTTPYGVPTSRIHHQDSNGQDRRMEYPGATSDDVRAVGSFHRDRVNHSGITSHAYTPDGDERRGHAHVREESWQARGGSTYNLYGVVPDRDATKEASIKSRGEKALEKKVPL